MRIFALTLLALTTQAQAADLTSEIAKIAGQYELSKTSSGTCPASITMEKDSFNTTQTAGLGIYGDQPGDVVIQLASLNSGKLTQNEENPMTGAFAGTESEESTLVDGKITGSNENDDASGQPRFRYDFTASYTSTSLSYEVKYVSAMNGICFDNVCEYVKK